MSQKSSANEIFQYVSMPYWSRNPGLNDWAQTANAYQPEALLSYGAGIALVIASLAFFVRHVGDGKPNPDD